MGKPNILTVVRPVEGGIRAHIKNLVQELHEDFSFSVACPWEQSADFSAYTREVLPLPLQGKIHPYHDARTMLHLQNMLRTGKYALVHAHGFKAALLARPVAKLYNVPCLVTIHGDFAHAAGSVFGALYKKVERTCANWATGYITVAQWLAEDLENIFNVDRSRITVIPNGIPFKQMAENTRGVLPFPPNTRIVGTVGRLVMQKGLKYFVMAAAQLAKEWPDLRFVVVGDGPLKPELEMLAHELGLGKKIFFAGQRADVSTLLCGFDVFVQPSVSEGQGITALEAMAAGCPVVASNTGGLRELISHNQNGLLVEPKNSEHIVAAVSRLLTDEALRQSIVQKGLLSLENFSLDKMIGRMRMLYGDILEGRWPA